MADHELTNFQVFEKTGLLPIETYVELRRTRWLEKISNMSEVRFPGSFLVHGFHTYVCTHAQRNGNAGRPQQTIRYLYLHTYPKTTRI